jgi:hypothetical protein
LIICLYLPYRGPKFTVNYENSALAGVRRAVKNKPPP